jgi:Zn-dependent peptidase ImmA (M78 family)
VTGRPDQRAAITAARRIRALITDDPDRMIETIRIAAAVGLKVVFCAMQATAEDRDVSSFLHRGCIYVVDDQHPVDQRFAIAREIGRHVLHADRIGTKGYDAVSSRHRDHRDADTMEAEVFATHLLAPDAAIRKWTRRPLRDGIASLSVILAVPADMLVARLPNDIRTA